MAKRKYVPEEANADGWSDWIHPLVPYRMACCDCGLVHDLEFQLDGRNQLNFRARRNNRSTAALRRQDRQRTTDGATEGRKK